MKSFLSNLCLLAVILPEIAWASAKTTVVAPPRYEIFAIEPDYAAMKPVLAKVGGAFYVAQDQKPPTDKPFLLGQVAADPATAAFLAALGQEATKEVPAADSPFEVLLSAKPGTPQYNLMLMMPTDRGVYLGAPLSTTLDKNQALLVGLPTTKRPDGFQLYFVRPNWAELQDEEAARSTSGLPR